MLTASDPLGFRPRRILVAGTSGSGKTTLATAIGALLGVPCTEMDALFHGPGWTLRDSFEADVRALAATEAWVTEWQYPAVRDLLLDRADLLVWLDLSRAVVLGQVVRRTLARWARRTTLWNGNVEPPLRTVLTDPEHVVRGAWSSHPRTAERVAAAQHRRPGLGVVRLRSHRESAAGWRVRCGRWPRADRDRTGSGGGPERLDWAHDRDSFRPFRIHCQAGRGRGSAWLLRRRRPRGDHRGEGSGRVRSAGLRA